MAFWNRIKEHNAAVGLQVTAICDEWGVPDVPFDLKAAVREVMAGKRPGVARDGRWWFAAGVEQVGKGDRTRILVEDQASSEADAVGMILAWLDQFSGPAVAPPHLPEGIWFGTLQGVHRDILHSRITGRQRPIGGWAVAVPPHLIGSRRR